MVKQMNNIQLLQEALKRDNVFDQVKGCIEDAQKAKQKQILDSPFYGNNKTVRDFQQRPDFYGSRLFLKEITDVYVARLARAAAMKLDVPWDKAFDVIQSPETAIMQLEVVEMLYDYYMKKNGPVPEERVKVLDNEIKHWQEEAELQLRAITNTINSANRIH